MNLNRSVNRPADQVKDLTDLVGIDAFHKPSLDVRKPGFSQLFFENLADSRADGTNRKLPREFPDSPV